ncbi:MAG TPA: hypothetical protein VL331_09645 [Croceibacterium sp.]|nr:hypothetical protein [Croceibacterium sp.]
MKLPRPTLFAAKKFEFEGSCATTSATLLRLRLSISFWFSTVTGCGVSNVLRATREPVTMMAFLSFAASPFAWTLLSELDWASARVSAAGCASAAAASSAKAVPLAIRPTVSARVLRPRRAKCLRETVPLISALPFSRDRF